MRQLFSSFVFALFLCALAVWVPNSVSAMPIYGGYDTYCMATPACFFPDCDQGCSNSKCQAVCAMDSDAVAYACGEIGQGFDPNNARCFYAQPWCGIYGASDLCGCCFSSSGVVYDDIYFNGY